MSIIMSLDEPLPQSVAAVLGSTAEAVEMTSFVEEGKAEPPAPKREVFSPPLPLFVFPDVINTWIPRFVAIQVVCLGLLVIIFRTRPWQWVAVGMGIDYVLRLLGGASPSLLGANAQLLVALCRLKPRFGPGAPKQLAAAIATTFCLVSSLLFFTDHEVAGAAVMAGLVAAAALEGFLGICLACIMFGFLPASLTRSATRVYEESADELLNALAKQQAMKSEPYGERRTFQNSNAAETPIDLGYKMKTRQMRLTNFHPIRNLNVTYFAMSMGLAAVALVWQTYASVNEKVSKLPFYISSYVSAVVFGLLLAAYLAKTVLYPHKVIKEWRHPLYGHFFPAISISLVAHALLVQEESQDLAEVLFWVGAVTQMLVTVVKLSQWTTQRWSEENITAAWMVPPVGCFVVAVAAPTIDAEYSDVGYFYFGIAAILYLVLLTITLRKATIDHNADDRLRPLLFLWVAAPAVAALALLTLEGAWSTLALALYFVAVVFLLAAAHGFLSRFHGRMPFHMAYWGYCFPVAIFAVATLQYDQLRDHRISNGMAVAAVLAANALAAILSIHTLRGIVSRTVFKPELKWGPLSLMPITHIAFRAGMMKMVKMQKQGNAKKLLALWRGFAVTMHEHSRHEDLEVFQHFNQMFPLVGESSIHEHHALHESMDELEALMGALASAGSDEGARKAALAALAEPLTRFKKVCVEHLSGEEFHLNPVGRKHTPVDRMRVLVRSVWATTEVTQWAKIMPWVVNVLPKMAPRKKYIKAWLWAMPERRHQIGMILYRGVSDVMWKRITDDIPELIPRGLPGWVHAY